MHPGEAQLSRRRGEPRPPDRGLRGTDVTDDDGQAGAETVRARPLVMLKLEQLHHPRLLGGGSHQPQRPVGAGQQQARRVDLQQLHAPLSQRLQELHQVVSDHQRVRQLDERLRQTLAHGCCHSRTVDLLLSWPCRRQRRPRSCRSGSPGRTVTPR